MEATASVCESFMVCLSKVNAQAELVYCGCGFFVRHESCSDEWYENDESWSVHLLFIFVICLNGIDIVYVCMHV